MVIIPGSCRFVVRVMPGGLDPIPSYCHFFFSSLIHLIPLNLLINTLRWGKFQSYKFHKGMLICTHTHTLANAHIYTAQTYGQLRLVRNGFSHGTFTSGRLEVYYSGQWGTVCNDLWDSTNTRVACRQLGFLGSSTSWTTSSAGG